MVDIYHYVSVNSHKASRYINPSVFISGLESKYELNPRIQSSKFRLLSAPTFINYDPLHRFLFLVKTFCTLLTYNYLGTTKYRSKLIEGSLIIPKIDRFCVFFIWSLLNTSSIPNSRSAVTGQCQILLSLDKAISSFPYF